MMLDGRVSKLSSTVSHLSLCLCHTISILFVGVGMNHEDLVQLLEAGHEVFQQVLLLSFGTVKIKYTKLKI